MYERIRALREDKDLTQQEMGQILMCSQRIYSNYERGDADVPTPSPPWKPRALPRRCFAGNGYYPPRLLRRYRRVRRERVRSYRKNSARPSAQVAQRMAGAVPASSCVTASRRRTNSRNR